ncbi:MAG: hypothetical protein HY918_01945 [Candidatus Doudnabacteria bacterium]|nr:hypothetical protein [Candidatus Doudnabacteria bacterium]
MQTQNKEATPLSVNIAGIGLLLMLFCVLMSISNLTAFNRNIEEPLSRAAYSKSTKECLEHLSVAISHLKEMGFQKTPNNAPRNQNISDTQAWFNNLANLQEALERQGQEGFFPSGEEMLETVREKILKEERGLLVVESPTGISTYPYGILYLCWALVSTMMFVGGLGWWVAKDDNGY